MPETRPAPERIEHLLPAGAVAGPVELSIVVPALNEALTVGEFVEWCHEGLRRAGVTGQILIIDSSTDETPDIVLAHGGEVLRVPKRGLGRAYIDAIPYIRGRWVVMGDADLTYDFRELDKFVAEFQRGAEFVMGSRFRGTIEAGAMPGTKEALERIDLRSQSWEYASEMVLKAARLKLRLAEVPVTFYKDREGRLSHHRRAGWLSPWIAGWINLRAMLIYSPDSFLMKPGFLLLALGLVLAVPLGFGPITIGPIGFNLHWMLFGLTCATLGYSCIQIAVIAREVHGLRAGIETRIARFLGYNRGMTLAGVLSGLGMLLVAILAWTYVSRGLALNSVSYPAILGLLLIILGFQTFSFTLLLEMSKRLVDRVRR